ncbi:conserved exported hypothetical protein [uncultured spirochete]|uniref:Periplasmic binding protein domain-containing protein n=1 Tax=uncultured spirochete TaxID=156406 RepID=A0A3P3XMG6_9SPIR|nr:conserved exported hypothetical protein [uncultured spirochete]
MKKVLTAALIVLVLSTVCVFADAKGVQKGYVIALSNSFYGNSWRKQMVDCFTKSAMQAKAAGRISDFIIVNGDGTQNTQISQLNSLILSDVDAICINAASPTALNGVIEKAIKKGIKVITFDSIVTQPDAYKMDFDFYGQGKTIAKYCVDRFKGKANVLFVRGIRGSDPEIQLYNGAMSVLKANPGMKVVAEADGEADAAISQSAVSNILPSLNNIDVAITTGGEYGVVQAFEAAGRKVPVIIGSNRSEFIKWWIDEKAKNGYETVSISSEPSIGSVVVWLAIHILEGDKVPNSIKLNSILVTNKTVDQYKDLLPGTVIAQDYDEQFVIDMLKNLNNR